MKNFEAQNFVLSRKSLDSDNENCKSYASNALNVEKANNKKGSKHVAFSKYMNILFVALLYAFLQVRLIKNIQRKINLIFSSNLLFFFFFFEN